jgi:hypothetical protein
MKIFFPQKFATTTLQMMDQIDPLHAMGTTKASRTTAAPSRDCS